LRSVQHPAGDSAQEQREAVAAALARVAAGDQAALKDVYSRTSAKLFGLCLRILGDRGEAEDALQEVYLSVWRRAGSFDPARASAITWLAALARNRSIDRLRSSGRQRPAAPIEEALDLPDQSAGADSAAEAAEARGRLTLCLAELEKRQADSIRAAFFSGDTYKQLAARAEVPEGTMKSWIRRGLLRLRECLER
jgi:RNA polymerase sigma factor (sigma-70 family)